MSQNASIIQYYGAGIGHSCGYCNSLDGNFSYGMHAYSLLPDDYQNLIDRGWRRSGCYVYKPQLDIQCCPMYTIKCDAVNFKPSNSHKKVIKTFNRYINYGIKPRKYQAEDGQIKEAEDDGDNSSARINIDETNDNSDNSNNNSCIKNSFTSKEKHIPKPGKGADPEKPAAQKAKVVRMMKKKMKAFQAGDASSDKVFKEFKTKEKSLEDFLDDFVENPVHRFEIITIPATESYTQRLTSSSHQTYHRYQTIIHHDPPHKPSPKQFTRFLVNSPLFNNEHCVQSFCAAASGANNNKSNVSKENNTNQSPPSSAASSSSFSSKIKTVASHSINMKRIKMSANIEDSFRLFHAYQSAIHKDDDNDIHSYNDFLVQSPIITEDNNQVPQGTFHQQYYIDDQLVCVGVVDVLSKCLSSVYLFYNPDFAFLSLGTYTALRELAYTRQLHKQNSNISSYYMGFYIHSCDKMRYKGQYRPSYLLCPESHTWQPIERSLELIEKNKYTRLADLDTVDSGIVGLNVNGVKIHSGGDKKEIKRKVKMNEGEIGRKVREYAQLVGKKCAYNLFYYIHG